MSYIFTFLHLRETLIFCMQHTMGLHLAVNRSDCRCHLCKSLVVSQRLPLSDQSELHFTHWHLARPSPQMGECTTCANGLWCCESWRGACLMTGATRAWTPDAERTSGSRGRAASAPRAGTRTTAARGRGCQPCQRKRTFKVPFEYRVNSLLALLLNDRTSHFDVTSEWSEWMSSVLWLCWLGGRKGIQAVKTEWWGTSMVICLERGANDLHMVQISVGTIYRIVSNITILALYLYRVVSISR